jgi:hypothetical protein
MTYGSLYEYTVEYWRWYLSIRHDVYQETMVRMINDSAVTVFEPEAVHDQRLYRRPRPWPWGR